MVPDISIVIPAYNEEACLQELCQRLQAVLSALNLSAEIILVDDGSSDGTFQCIRELSSGDPGVSGLRFSRNFGHQAALTAGLARAQGKAVITLDADLQHPPEVIPLLVRKWQEGYEVVATLREQTESSSFFKNFTSRIFYRLINRLSPLPIKPGAADFRLLDRRAVDALNAMPERTRFLRGLVPWIGFRQTEITFKAPDRYAGTSRYTFRKMLRFALDGILSLSALPLRFATLMGLGVMGIGLLYGLYVVWTAIMNPESQPGWASIILLMLFLGGMQIFCMGIIGEYLARVFDEVKRRPLYIIAETVGEENKVSESPPG
jgi:dolichol-phosphate mannosyltransferase